jgi:thymidine kinase
MSLEIILGPMFSGKSSRIVSIVSRYGVLRAPVLVIKHAADNRYAQNEVATHDGRTAPCVTAADFSAFNDAYLNRFQVIIVEEAQFFQGLVDFVRHVVDDLGKNVYLVGLDGDSERRPFGEILQCVPMADKVEKLTALCVRCANGTPAIFTRRRVPYEQQMVVAGSNLYEPVCRECYFQFNAMDVSQMVE